ncbi:hypothetical protein B0H19DRAFT_1231116 [Mycena capillaripes]|nr:hypothetical protein B0H19DRAFT_1231116 [Mycena capillaripes]
MENTSLPASTSSSITASPKAVFLNATHDIGNLSLPANTSDSVSSSTSIPFLNATQDIGNLSLSAGSSPTFAPNPTGSATLNATHDAQGPSLSMAAHPSGPIQNATGYPGNGYSTPSGGIPGTPAAHSEVSRGPIIGAAVGGGIAVCVIVLAGALFCWRYRVSKAPGVSVDARADGNGQYHDMSEVRALREQLGRLEARLASAHAADPAKEFLPTYAD